MTLFFAKNELGRERYSGVGFDETIRHARSVGHKGIQPVTRPRPVVEGTPVG